MVPLPTPKLFFKMVPTQIYFFKIGDQGPWDRDQGSGTGTRDQGPGPRTGDQGPGPGPGTMDQGPGTGTRDQDQDRNQGPGTGTRDLLSVHLWTGQLLRQW